MRIRCPRTGRRVLYAVLAGDGITCAFRGWYDEKETRGRDVMNWKIDGDGMAFHVWLSNAEFAKLRRDANSAAIELQDYLVEMVADPALEAVAGAIRSGSQEEFQKLPSSESSNPPAVAADGYLGDSGMGCRNGCGKPGKSKNRANRPGPAPNLAKPARHRMT
jgi:hypothetical protein